MALREQEAIKLNRTETLEWVMGGGPFLFYVIKSGA